MVYFSGKNGILHNYSYKRREIKFYLVTIFPISLLIQSLLDEYMFIIHGIITCTDNNSC